MKRYFIFVTALTFYSFSGNSQGNLVPNPNFEIYSPCPNSTAQITNCTGWINAATRTSPDYFNTCATFSTGVNVPYSLGGYQPDKIGGGGYAGIYTFNWLQKNDGREYIQVKLNDTLKAGKKYLASMYVSLINWYDYAISTMGMYFTATAIQAPSTVGFINVPNPQVKNTTPLTDTLNWMLVRGTVTGTGTELYLTIGNFSYDSLSDTLRVKNPLNNPYSYYYIDGVSVIEDVAEIGINEVKKVNSEIKIFPNPSKDMLSISIENICTQKINISIRTILGEIVYNTDEENISTNFTKRINLQDFVNGTYFLQVKTKDKIYTHKIIVA